MKVIYISGPISNHIPEGYDELHGKQLNVLNASQVAIRCIEAGWAVICPHKNTSMFYNIPWDIMLEMDCELVKRCDAILMLENWEKSPGAVRERKCAMDAGIPVYYYKDGIPDPSWVLSRDTSK